MDRARLATIYDHALPRADALLEAARHDVVATREPGVRAAWLVERATLRAWQNRHGEAIATARAATRQPLPTDPREAALLSARTFDVLAESTFYKGDPPGAVAPYRRQLAILAAALRRWPDDPQVRRAFARATWALGTTLIELGQNAEALTLIERGLVEIRALAAQDRDNADAQRMLRVQEAAYAQALSATGRPVEAIAAMEGNVRERRTAWLSRPGEAMAQRDYAVAVAALGDLLAQDGRLAQACRTYAGAEAMFEHLRRRGQLIDSDRAYAHRLLSEARAKLNCPA